MYTFKSLLGRTSAEGYTRSTRVVATVGLGGPSKEAVMRVHERAGHPVTEVYELTAEV